jgi:hypothetical protein
MHERYIHRLVEIATRQAGAAHEHGCDMISLDQRKQNIIKVIMKVSAKSVGVILVIVSDTERLHHSLQLAEVNFIVASLVASSVSHTTYH